MLAFTRCLLQSSKVTAGRLLWKERKKILCHQRIHKFFKVYSSTYNSDFIQSSDIYSDDESEIMEGPGDNGIQSTNNKWESPLYEGESEREFDDKTAAEYLSNLNEEEEKKLKVIKLEYEYWSSSGLKVPDIMPDKWWAQLLHNCKSYSKRKKTLKWLRKLELHEMVEEKKKKARMEILAKKMEENPQKDVNQYTIYLRTYKAAILKACHTRVTHAMMFNRPLVLDMDYEDYMSLKEIKGTIKQVTDAYGFNQRRLEPYDLSFTNFKKDKYIYKKICHVNRHSEVEGMYCSRTEKSYMDLYPAERLVYLTPDAEHELLEDDIDNIYIIGCFVDTGVKTQASLPLSLAKAKKENIRCRKLPFDKYVLWRQGTKAITINNMVQIMTTFMDTNDWNKAFKFLPRRKLHNDEYEEGDQIPSKQFQHNKRMRDGQYSSKYRVY